MVLFSNTLLPEKHRLQPKIRLQNSRFFSKIVNSLTLSFDIGSRPRVGRPLERVRKKYGCFAVYRKSVILNGA